MFLSQDALAMPPATTTPANGTPGNSVENTPNNTAPATPPAAEAATIFTFSRY